MTLGSSLRSDCMPGSSTSCRSSGPRCCRPGSSFAPHAAVRHCRPPRPLDLHRRRMPRRLLQLFAGLGTVLGGNLNAGTVLIVLTIGPIVHVFLPRLIIGEPATAS